jgi:hypothetical protein
MNTKTQNRITRLMPNGQPRYVRCYDNGGETADRFTVCFTGRAATTGDGYRRQFNGLAMCGSPFHPQGFGQHWHAERQPDTNQSGFAPAIGRKCQLGTRIPFAELPVDCRKLVMQDYREIWNLNG